MKGEKSERLQQILVDNETVENTFSLKGVELYATNQRLITIQGRTIRDFDYAHISSVAYSSKRYWGLIVGGILIAVFGVAGGQFLDTVEIAIGSLGVGLVLIIIGALVKPEWVEVNVVGLSDPIKFSGSKKDLDSLLHTMRQKRYSTTAEKGSING